MTLLELDHVAKRCRHGKQELDVLHDVSLELHEAEMVAVCAYSRAGRVALSRIAAGIEAPDAGAVRFRGAELRGAAEIAGGLAYCRPAMRGAAGESVRNWLVYAQLARGVPSPAARAHAAMALERGEAGDCAGRALGELDGAEVVRVSIAAALVQQPALLVVDEPTTNVELLQRDRILALLRSLRDQGLAVLTCVDRGTGLFGADRALSLSGGELRGHLTPELAPVVQMPVRASG